MLQKFLAWISILSVRHPWRIVAAIVLPQIVLGFFTVGAPWDMSFGGLLNRHNPDVARYLDTIKEIRFGGRLLLLLEGPEDELSEKLPGLVAKLENMEEVQSVSMPPETAWLKSNAPFLVEPEIFNAWLGVAAEPENESHPKLLEQAQRKLDLAERMRALEGHRLLQVTTVSDPLDLAAGGADYFALEEATQRVLQENQLKGTYTGLGAVAAQDQHKTLSVMERLTPASFAVVLFLFWLVEPRPLRLVLVSIPMLLALWATMGTVALVLGKLTLMESLFGIMIFGLGIDFALHLMVRFREERALGKSYEEAVHHTVAGTGHGVLAGGLTTAGAFLIAGCADDVSMKHLGFSGGVGLLFCLLGTVTLLPAFWTLFEPKNRQDESLQKDFHVPLLPSLARLAVRNPWPILAFTLAMSIFAYLGFQHQVFQTDLQKVFNRDVPAMEVADRIQSIYGMNGSSWMVLAKDVEEAAAYTAKMKEVSFVDRVDSISEFLRPDAAERHRQIGEHQKAIRDQIKLLETMRYLSTEEEEQELLQGIEAMQVLLQAGSIDPPTLENLPQSLRALLQVHDGRYLVQGYARAPALDGDLAIQERRAIERILPEAFSFNLLLEDMMASTRPWFVPVFVSIVCFVALLLWWDLRRFRLMVLSLLPVLVGLLWTFGFMCWLGVEFNMLMVGVMPLVIGLGVDDGIHVVRRMQEEDRPSPGEAAVSVGRAITMTTITTCSSFAVTLFANHPGLESMGKVMLFGLPICLLTSVMIIPALATVWRAPASN